MCGIWAIFGDTNDISIHSNEAQKIKHRGPDAFRMESVQRIPNCCLGVHRLAVIDILRGQQPMKLVRYPHVVLIYNGEIYNHQMLKKEFGFQYDTQCDGEAIIHLYTYGGIEFCAKQLDGEFAFCLVDTLKRRVFLGRDTYGIKPMFKIYNDSGFLALCSEMKGLMGFTNGAHRGQIEHFLPGHIESYTLDLHGQATLEERIQFHKIDEAPVYQSFVEIREINDVKKNIRCLLEAAVEKRMMADRRVGCFLSGGLDSSLITSIACRKAKELKLPYRIQTFTIGLEGSPDLIAAKKMADLLQTEHHEILFNHKEGFDALHDVIYYLESYNSLIIRTSIAQFLLCKYIKENTNTTVILSGEGADEVAQGYFHFHKAPSGKEADEASRRHCSNLHYLDVLRTDRTSSAWGLEVRVPFLDHTFSSYYLSLPGGLKQPQKGIEKHLLRAAFDGDSLLPKDILWRPKVEFSEGLCSKTKPWYHVLQEFIDKEITDKEFAESAQQYTIRTPKTKEALYYRRIYDKFYPNQDHLVPCYWVPQWIPETDSSAWRMEHYKLQ